MEFNTAYNTPHKTEPEKNSGEIITDSTGYVSADVRINTLINAGQQLVEWRNEQAELLDGMYRDERALPYRPDELHMLELNALTVPRARSALQRIRDRIQSLGEASREPQEPENEAPQRPKKQAKKGEKTDEETAE